MILDEHAGTNPIWFGLQVCDFSWFVPWANTYMRWEKWSRKIKKPSLAKQGFSTQMLKVIVKIRHVGSQTLVKKNQSGTHILNVNENSKTRFYKIILNCLLRLDNKIQAAIRCQTRTHGVHRTKKVVHLFDFWKKSSCKHDFRLSTHHHFRLHQRGFPPKMCATGWPEANHAYKIHIQ